MSFIRTVRGDISPEQLGFCQAHEHLFVRKGPASDVNPDLRIDAPEKTLRELALYRAAGGNALVDAQPVGAGRMASRLAWASYRSGVHVMAATGFHRPLFYGDGHWRNTAETDRLRDLFLRELTVGMYDGGAKSWPSRRAQPTVKDDPPPRAGIVKVALGPEGITGRTEVLCEAAAAAAAETGAPVLIHTEAGKAGPEAVTWFQARGVAPAQQILCHLDRLPDNGEVLVEVMATGAWVELDTLFRPKYVTQEAAAGRLAGLAAAGHADRMLLGLDTTRARMRSYGGSPGLDAILTVLLPKLREKGVPDKAIRVMTVDNPARALTWRPGMVPVDPPVCGQASVDAHLATDAHGRLKSKETRK